MAESVATSISELTSLYQTYYTVRQKVAKTEKECAVAKDENADIETIEQPETKSEPKEKEKEKKEKKEKKSKEKKEKESRNEKKIKRHSDETLNERHHHQQQQQEEEEENDESESLKSKQKQKEHKKSKDSKDKGKKKSKKDSGEETNANEECNAPSSEAENDKQTKGEPAKDESSEGRKELRSSKKDHATERFTSASPAIAEPASTSGNSTKRKTLRPEKTALDDTSVPEHTPHTHAHVRPDERRKGRKMRSVSVAGPAEEAFFAKMELVTKHSEQSRRAKELGSPGGRRVLAGSWGAEFNLRTSLNTSLQPSFDPILFERQLRRGTVDEILDKCVVESTGIIVPMFVMTYSTFMTAEQVVAGYEKRMATAGERDRAAIAGIAASFIRKNSATMTKGQLLRMQELIRAVDPELCKTCAAYLSAQRGKRVTDYTTVLTGKPAKGQPFGPTVIKLEIPTRSLYQTLLEITPEDLAEQLTVADFKAFGKITSQELLFSNWTRERTRFKSPYVRGLMKRSTQLTRWVIWSILVSPSLPVRVRLLTKFMQAATYLAQANNYMGLMSISGALNSAPIMRLENSIVEVKERVRREFLESMEVMEIDTTSHKRYREKIKELLVAEKFVLPYLGFHLTDIVFIEDGNPSTVTDDDGTELVNVKKREQLYKVIQEILECQVIPPPYTENPEITAMLETVPAPGWTEDEFSVVTFDLSKAAEGR